MTLIDFTQLPRRNKMYAGANGKKICVVYEGAPYMLKWIDMVHIREIIDETPFISDLQRRFYLTMLTERKRLILDFSLAALN